MGSSAGRQHQPPQGVRFVEANGVRFGNLAPISGGHFCHRESPASALAAIIGFLK
jgi:hypothetical protein